MTAVVCIDLVSVALELKCITETNPIRVNYLCISHYFNGNSHQISCTYVTRQSASVIKVGVMYLGITYILKCSKNKEDL